MDSKITPKMNNKAITTSTHIIGSSKGGGKANVKELMKHDGIVLGGSVTGPRPTASAASIDMLPGRQDGKIL